MLKRPVGKQILLEGADAFRDSKPVTVVSGEWHDMVTKDQ